MLKRKVIKTEKSQKIIDLKWQILIKIYPYWYKEKLFVCD